MERFYPFDALIALKRKAPATYSLVQTKVSELETFSTTLSQMDSIKPENYMCQLAMFLDYIDSLTDLYSDIRKSYFKVAHSNFFNQKIDAFQSRKTRIAIALALLEDINQLEQ